MKIYGEVFVRARQEQLRGLRQEIAGFPQKEIPSSWMRKMRVIGPKDAVEKWAGAMGILPVRQIQCSRGSTLFFRKADLSALIDGLPVPQASERLPFPPASTSERTSVEVLFERFQRDFSVNNDALFSEIQDLVTQQQAANQLLFRKLVELEAKLDKLAEEWA